MEFGDTEEEEPGGQNESNGGALLVGKGAEEKWQMGESWKCAQIVNAKATKPLFFPPSPAHLETLEIVAESLLVLSHKLVFVASLDFRGFCRQFVLPSFRCVFFACRVGGAWSDCCRWRRVLRDGEKGRLELEGERVPASGLAGRSTCVFLIVGGDEYLGEGEV